MSNGVIELELVPTYKMFYGNDFGVYGCRTSETSKVTLNKYYSFTIVGVMPELTIGTTYQATLIETEDKKYGTSYKVEMIKQDIPKTPAAQHAYLRSILPESHAEAIIRFYPTEDIISKVKDGSFNFKDIKGIGEITYQKIKTKIIDNFEIQEALVELTQYGVTYTIIKKLIKHYNGSAALVVQKVKENIYCILEVENLGFLKVDKYALEMNIDKDSPYRLNAAITYTLEQEENNGHCWIKLKELYKKVGEITDLSQEMIENHVNSEDILDHYIDDNRIGLKRNHTYESKIKDCLFKLMEDDSKFDVPDVEERIKETEAEQGFEFTDEQKNIIRSSIKDNVIIISGKAGSGKSSVLKGVMNVLRDYTYETCAFSGKAAQRIIESTGLKSKTIHRLLEYKPHTGFTYNEKNQMIDDTDVLDEGSMVPSSLFYNLISAIPKGSKFIICGDIEQLSAIGAGAPLLDMINSGVIPVYELTQVHRQALMSGILMAANYIREGQQITGSDQTGNNVVGELKDLHIMIRDGEDEIFNKIVDICEKNKDKFDLMDFQVIVPMKSRGSICTKNLNIALQKIFNPDEYGDKPFLKRNGYDFRVGDKIIKRSNDYENSVFNGTLGFIVNIDMEEKIAGIQFLGLDEIVYYSQDELSGIDMAYALTVHSVQGSQFKNVIVGLDYSAYVLLCRQLIYTALTRASKMCVLICENRALRYAISQNHANKRNTFLLELLKKGDV